MNERVNDIDDRVTNLEVFTGSLDDRLLKTENMMQGMQTKLAEHTAQSAQTESTVLKESSKQKEMTQKLLDYVLEDKTALREGKQYNRQQMWILLGKIGGAGGIAYVLFELFQRAVTGS
ncbi:hypothetical protein [Alkalicoccobacillus murimartini]|uniref:Uncharacterized protein n=1 Tax=Alkalicoccobacillus murimartini TaxID=171685 RepID=A0ABT9YN71_9BACI|nr:hypothetical protein [Alkalicoccobacillus murimartini]MDQ0208936.1 hypothetical protein [Alkalicoccobacillus murimartini]